MSRKPPNVLRNTAANWLSFGFAAIVGFFLAPFVVHHLGDSAYGIWILLGSFVGYLGLLDFGVRGAVTRFIADSHGRADHGDASSIVSGALRLFSILAAATILISGLLAALANRLFDLPPDLVTDARLVILLGGAAVAASFIGGVYSGIVTGLQRFDLDGAVEIAMTAVRAIAVVVALRLGYGLVALGVIQLSISVLRGAIAWIVVRVLYPEISVSASERGTAVIRRILAFSLFSSLIHWSGLLIYYTDSLVIATFLPIGMVTYFAIAGSLTDYARQLVSALTRVITPRASAAAATGGQGDVADLVLATGPLASLIVIPIALTFLLRGERFINMWMGPDYGPKSAPVLWILSVTVWLVGGRGIITGTLMGMNRHRGLAAAFVTEALANLGLSIGLIGSLGLVGVAAGTTIPSTIVALAVMPWLVTRHLAIPVGRLFERLWIRPSLACAGFAGGTYLMERYATTPSLAVFFLQTALLLPLVLGGAWLLVFSPAERSALRAWAGAAMSAAMLRVRR